MTSLRNAHRKSTPRRASSISYPVTPPSTGRKSTHISPQARSTPVESYAIQNEVVTPPSPISPTPATRTKPIKATTTTKESTQTITTLLSRTNDLLQRANRTTLLLEQYGDHVFRAAACRLTLHLNNIRAPTQAWAGRLEEHMSPTLTQILERYHREDSKTPLLIAQYADMLVFEAGLAGGNAWADVSRACAVAKRVVTMSVLEHSEKAARLKMAGRRHYTAKYAGLLRDSLKKVLQGLVVGMKKARREIEVLKAFVGMKKVGFEGMVASIGEGERKRCMAWTEEERDVWAKKLFGVALQRGQHGGVEELDAAVGKVRAMFIVMWMTDFDKNCQELIECLGGV